MAATITSMENDHGNHTTNTELHNIVKGTELCPVQAAPPTEANTKEITDWQSWELKARLEILLHMEDSLKQSFRTLTSATAIWHRLEETFECKDVASQISNLKKLLNMSLQEEAEVPKFVETWQLQLDETILFGVDLGADVQAMLLLASLPSTWQPFIATRMAAQLTTTAIIPAILQEFTLRTAVSGASSSNSLVMYAKPIPQPSGQSLIVGISHHLQTAPVTKHISQLMMMTVAITYRIFPCRTTAPNLLMRAHNSPLWPFMMTRLIQTPHGFLLQEQPSSKQPDPPSDDIDDDAGAASPPCTSAVSHEVPLIGPLVPVFPPLQQLQAAPFHAQHFTVHYHPIALLRSRQHAQQRQLLHHICMPSEGCPSQRDYHPVQTKWISVIQSPDTKKATTRQLIIRIRLPNLSPHNQSGNLPMTAMSPTLTGTSQPSHLTFPVQSTLRLRDLSPSPRANHPALIASPPPTVKNRNIADLYSSTELLADYFSLLGDQPSRDQALS